MPVQLKDAKGVKGCRLIPLLVTQDCIDNKKWTLKSQKNERHKSQSVCEIQGFYSIAVMISMLTVIIIVIILLNAGRAFNRRQCERRHHLCCVRVCNVSIWYWTRCFAAFLYTKSQSTSHYCAKYALFKTSCT